MRVNSILLACCTALLPMLSTCKYGGVLITLEEPEVPVATTVSTAIQGNPPPYKVGYVGCWSLNIDCNVIEPEEIDASGYTNLIFAFVGINSQYRIDFMRKEDRNYLRRLVVHVNKNYPGVKVSVSLGGYSFNDNPRSMIYFSPMVSSPENRAKFVTSVVAFIDEYRLSGIDFDWEDPESKIFEYVLKVTQVDKKEAALISVSNFWTDPESHTNVVENSDVANFALLLEEMRTAFQTNYQISVVFPVGNPYWLTSIKLVSVASLVDFMTLLALEYRGVWLNNDDQFESMMPRIGIDEIKDCVELLTCFGIPKNKIILALPFYGHTYTSQVNNGQGSPYKTYGNTIVQLQDPEISDQVTYTEDIASNTRIAYFKNDQGYSTWITYQTPESFLVHVSALKEIGLGGFAGMFIDMDDNNHSLSLVVMSEY